MPSKARARQYQYFARILSSSFSRSYWSSAAWTSPLASQTRQSKLQVQNYCRFLVDVGEGLDGKAAGWALILSGMNHLHDAPRATSGEDYVAFVRASVMLPRDTASQAPVPKSKEPASGIQERERLGFDRHGQADLPISFAQESRQIVPSALIACTFADSLHGKSQLTIANAVCQRP